MCTCCHKDFEVKTAKAGQRIVCKECAQKIKREVHRRRINEQPFYLTVAALWSWNKTTTKEVDEIRKELQTKMLTTADKKIQRGG